MSHSCRKPHRSSTRSELNPSEFVVPDLFMNELLAVLCRLPERRTSMVREPSVLVEALGIARIGNGHEFLARAADLAGRWRLSGCDAVYVALAELTGGAWLTADVRAARRVAMPGLVQVLGS